jgi:hypothetical protein
MFNPNNLALAIFNQLAPKQLPHALPIRADLSAVSSIEGEITAAEMEGKFEFAQSIYIDNRDSDTPVDFIVPGLANTRITCPGNSQALLPLMSPVPLRYVIEGTAAAENIVNILLLNVPMPYLVWGADDANAALLDEIIDLLEELNGTADGIEALLSTIDGLIDQLVGNMRGSYTDRSGAIAAADTWQQVAAANAARKKFFLTVRNTSSVSIWIAFGAAPANGTYDGAFELLPGQTWSDTPPTTTQAIHVQATSNAADVKFTALEM